MLGAIDSASYYVKDRRGEPIRIAMDEWNLQEWDHERFIEWLSLAYAYNPANPSSSRAARRSPARRGRPIPPRAMPAFLAERRKGDDDDAAVTLTDGLYAACIIHEMLAHRRAHRPRVLRTLVNGKGLIGGAAADPSSAGRRARVPAARLAPRRRGARQLRALRGL